ncbi:MAG: DUF2490 domain-containing protein [Reichenbachiella sp.]|uniref:DUF2490 domain-containing protein n=1 Tax=Reichenbachiella sp. TaxID=2184521 RepID=UPI00329A59B2
MRKLGKNLIGTLFLLLSTGWSFSNAQDSITNSTNMLWFNLNGTHELGSKLDFKYEVHYRTTEPGTQKAQFLIRPYLNYKFNSALNFAVGYTHLENFPYGEQPIPNRTPEDNIWLQVVLEHNSGTFEFSHRYRSEFRWVGLEEGASEERNHEFFERFRYRFTISKSEVFQRFGLKFFNEIWLNYGHNSNHYVFNQNWLYIGSFHPIGNRGSLHLGYQWMILNKADSIHRESNHILQIAFNYKINKNGKRK